MKVLIVLAALVAMTVADAYYNKHNDYNKNQRAYQPSHYGYKNNYHGRYPGKLPW